MSQNNQMVFVFSVASLIRFVSLFLTSLHLQRKIPILCALWKTEATFGFSANLPLSNKLDQLSNYFPSKAPMPQDDLWWWEGKVSMSFTSVAYTVSDSMLSFLKPLFLLMMAWLVMLIKSWLLICKDIQCWWNEKRKTQVESINTQFQMESVKRKFGNLKYFCFKSEHLRWN